MKMQMDFHVSFYFSFRYVVVVKCTEKPPPRLSINCLRFDFSMLQNIIANCFSLSRYNAQYQFFCLLGHGAFQQQEMKGLQAQAESCCVYVKHQKITQHMHGIIPYLFDCWADSLVHPFLLKSSVARPSQDVFLLPLIP